MYIFFGRIYENDVRFRVYRLISGKTGTCPTEIVRQSKGEIIGIRSLEVKV